MFLAGKARIASFILMSISMLFLSGRDAGAASLSLTPSSGTYEIGSTFDVSIMLNTEGQSVNAVNALLSFPPDILQVVSPSAGQSVVHLWASPPTCNNSGGTISLGGGFPNGTNLTNGLISKVTFRVKGIGTAIIKFLDDSEIFLNDGKGTKVLSQTNNGIYRLTLPAPAGPEVVSETHPDQSRWYNNPWTILEWADPDPELTKDYSYIMNDVPSDIPDDIAEGNKNKLSYSNLSDGRQYFHIKALNKDGVWGGTTHYSLNIDNTPPADFSVEASLSKGTDKRNVFVQFITTDALSGIDHYELKIVPLSKNKLIGEDIQENQKMFVEANSPYLIENLGIGHYDIIVRAYDSAGNYRDAVHKLKISNALFQFAGKEGLLIGGEKIISWSWIFVVFLLIIIALLHISLRLRHHDQGLRKAAGEKELPPEIKEKMEELKRLKKKYKGLAMLLFVIFGSFLLETSARAEDDILKIEPPIITTISENISNDEIFYVGGKTRTSGTKIDIYIKNSGTGETFSRETITDEKGEWFYRHDTFLSDGHYILWAQSKAEQQLSPPSPQVEMNIEKTAIEVGVSRISYELLLILVIGSLVLVVIALVFYIGLSVRRIHARNRMFKKEVDEVEDAVHKGFMMLHREIDNELKLIDKMKFQKDLSEKESAYREHLMNDIKRIERHIEKEIVDVERILGQ